MSYDARVQAALCDIASGIKPTHAVLYDSAPDSNFTPRGFIFGEDGEIAESFDLAPLPEGGDDGWDDEETPPGWMISNEARGRLLDDLTGTVKVKLSRPEPE